MACQKKKKCANKKKNSVSIEKAREKKKHILYHFSCMSLTILPNRSSPLFLFLFLASFLAYTRHENCFLVFISCLRLKNDVK